MPDDTPINKLGTTRYQQFAPWMGVPVQISRSAPQWMPGLDYITAFKPLGALVKIPDDDDFTVAYLERLDAHAETIRPELQRLSAKHPGQRLVLLCWCDTGKELCHRTLAAQWLHAKGLQVIEMPQFQHEMPDYVPHGAVPRERPVDPSLPEALF